MPETTETRTRIANRHKKILGILTTVIEDHSQHRLRLCDGRDDINQTYREWNTQQRQPLEIIYLGDLVQILVITRHFLTYLKETEVCELIDFQVKATQGLKNTLIGKGTE